MYMYMTALKFPCHSNWKDSGLLNRVSMHDMSFEMTLPSNYTAHTGMVSHECGSECVYSDYSAEKISDHSARTGMVSHQCGSECVL